MFPPQIVPVNRHKTGEPRMPQPPAPAPAKGTRPDKDSPVPVRFDDWASI